MLETDDIMHRGAHGLAFRSRIAVRQRHGDFFVRAKNDLRRMIAAVIDQRVMQPAKSSPRIDRHILDFEGLQQIDDNIGTPLGPRLFDFLRFRHKRIPFSTVYDRRFLR